MDMSNDRNKGLDALSMWNAVGVARCYLDGGYGNAEAELFSVRREMLLNILGSEGCIEPRFSDRNLPIAGILLACIDARAAFLPRRTPDMGEIYDVPRAMLSVLDNMLKAGLIALEGEPQIKVPGGGVFVPTETLLAILPEADFTLLLQNDHKELSNA